MRTPAAAGQPAERGRQRSRGLGRKVWWEHAEEGSPFGAPPMHAATYAGKQDTGSHRQQSHGHTSGQIASFIEATVALFFFGDS